MKKGAFTLVELIVVITILAILATIGFVSFSGYLAWARDTNRVAQLKSMSDALELYSTKKSLPIPDDKVDIKASSKTIAYQGYIWKNVLETIEYTESWLDPKDKNYFSYYLTRNKKYFQLLTFLEEESEDVLALNVGAPFMGALNATDYTERFPRVTGKKLWILLDSDKNPIQENSVITASWYLNISDLGGNNYISYISNTGKITGSGTSLSKLEKVVEWGWKWYSVKGWIISYRNVDAPIPSKWLLLELLFDGDFVDNTGGGNNGVWVGNASFTWWFMNESLYLEGVVWDYVKISPSELLQKQKDSFSWSFWFKSWNQPFWYARIIKFWDTVSSLWNYGPHKIRNWINVGGSRSTEIPSAPWMNDNKWHHIIFQWDGSTVEFYLDNKKIGSTSKTWVLAGYDTNSLHFWSSGFKWQIDNFRLYDDVLTVDDILELYNEKNFR